MSSLQKVCHQCGVQLKLGLANCPHCGAQVGTVFSETALPVEDVRVKQRKKIATQTSYYQKIETAQERANKALILALASFFFPMLGIIAGVIAIVFGAKAIRTLKEYNLEEGRGLATAGVVTGGIGLIAQACMIIYVVKMGLPF